MADDRQERGTKPQSAPADAAEAWRKSQPYFDAVWQLIGGVGLGVAGGIGLDRWLHTDPWGILGGSMLGMTVGFIGFFRSITKADKRK